MRSLGEWAPDISDLNTDTLDVARNVYPRANSWGPVYGLLAQSLAALPSACRGIWFVQKTDGSKDTYVATSAKIYKYNPDTLGFDDVSRTSGGDYNLPEGSYWSGKQSGVRLILTQQGDDPQYIDVDTGTNFDALGGNPPRASFVTVMDDRVVLWNLTSGPDSIAWSDINNSDEWTFGVADQQQFPDHGQVQGVFPHARLILLESGLRSIVSTGDTLSFEFPELAVETGTNAPSAAVEFGDKLFFLSEDGFKVGNANGIQSFSDGKVTEYFYNTVNRERLSQIFGTYDPFAPRIYFAYPTSDTEYNDRILVYDRSLGRFSEIVLDTYVLARLATAATSLEGGADDMDLDAPGMPSFDSRIYMGGAPILVAVGTDLKLSTLAGPTLEATLETCTYEFDEENRVRLQQVALRGEGTGVASATVAVAKMSTLDTTPVFGSAVSRQTSGRYKLNHDGKFHRLRWVVPAASDWNNVSGWTERHVVTSER